MDTYNIFEITVAGLLKILRNSTFSQSNTANRYNSNSIKYGTGNASSFACVHQAGDHKLYQYNFRSRFTK